MNCRNVLNDLSPFLDEMLERESALEVRDHLARCDSCSLERARLATLRSRLASLGRLKEPDYSRHLLQHRLRTDKRDRLGARFRDMLEDYWSRIRTTELLWYCTRLAGTAGTVVFFLMLSWAMNPVYFTVSQPSVERGDPMQNLRQQLRLSVLKNLGLLPLEAQRRPISPSDPMINDLYLLHFGESVSRMGADDSFSVVAEVDRSGAAKIQNVIEYPSDQSLLHSFSNMISTARCRPASQNGRAIDSHLVLSFNRISVYD